MNKFNWLLIVIALCSATAGTWLHRYLSYDFQTLAGDKYSWSKLSGNWVVINYFAEWCAPCLREIPELNQFNVHAQSNKHLKLFAVSYDDLDVQALTELKLKYEMQFPLITTGNNFMPMRKPQQLPATFIISPDGEVKKHLVGEQHAQQLIDTIEHLQGL